MPFRVRLSVFFGVIYRWCAVLESEVLSTKLSSAAEDLAPLGAQDPHGRVTEKRWAPAGIFVVACGRDMDFSAIWAWVNVGNSSSSEEMSARL